MIRKFKIILLLTPHFFPFLRDYEHHNKMLRKLDGFWAILDGFYKMKVSNSGILENDIFRSIIYANRMLGISWKIGSARKLAGNDYLKFRHYLSQIDIIRSNPATLDEATIQEIRNTLGQLFQ